MLLLPYRPIVASLPPDTAAAYAPVDGNGPPRTRHRFAMFRQRRDAGIRIAFGELRSPPSQVMLTVRAADVGRVVSVFSFQGRQIVAV